MLQTLLSVLLTAAAPILNPLDALTAMRDCVTVLEVYPTEGSSVPGVLFHVQSDPPSGGWLGLTTNTVLLPIDVELYRHPRHPEVSLSFAELADDQPQHDDVRANRDAIISCFESVL